MAIWIYSGRDGSTFYYDDNGNNHAYKNNDSLIINIRYNDEAKLLTIGKVIGNINYLRYLLFI